MLSKKERELIQFSKQNKITNKLTEEQEQAEALQQLKNIFDQQIIPLLIQSQEPELQFNNCLVNYQNAGINLQITMDLSSVIKSDKEVRLMEKYISNFKKEMN